MARMVRLLLVTLCVWLLLSPSFASKSASSSASNSKQSKESKSSANSVSGSGSTDSESSKSSESSDSEPSDSNSSKDESDSYSLECAVDDLCDLKTCVGDSESESESDSEEGEKDKESMTACNGAQAFECVETTCDQCTSNATQCVKLCEAYKKATAAAFDVVEPSEEDWPYCESECASVFNDHGDGTRVCMPQCVLTDPEQLGVRPLC